MGIARDTPQHPNHHKSVGWSSSGMDLIDESGLQEIEIGSLMLWDEDGLVQNDPPELDLVI